MTAMNDVRLDPYLTRIRYQGELAPDLATLARLHAAHVDAIPFDGLDPLIGRPVKLDLASVQQKLVDSRRGGYCFEHNTLFKAVLLAVGFKVTALGARVRWMSPPESPLGPREHMLLAVDLPEGTYLADVGFGACLLDTPLRFKTGIEQRTTMGTYKLAEDDGLYWLSAKQPAGWRIKYAFNMEPQIAADHELGNWYTSTSPAVPFTSMVIMERLAADKRYKLINRRFLTEARDGEVVSERALASAQELGDTLDKVFNIVLPVPAEEIFNRI